MTPKIVPSDALLRPSAAQIPGHIDRRNFLRQLTAGTVAAGAFVCSRSSLIAAQTNPASPKIRVGSNIYGWGQYYDRMGKKVSEHLDEVMSSLKNSGYEYLEPFLDVSHPDNNLRFADQSRSKGLLPVSIYTGASLIDPAKSQANIDKILAAAQKCRDAGFSVVDCNPDPIGREKTGQELAAQAAALDELGAGLRSLGLRFGIHNHMPEMANHAREFHYDLRHTQPDSVGFCYDVHWVYRGGLPPAKVLPEYGARIVSWHLRQSQNGIWCEALSPGDVDYSAVAKFARQHQLTAPYTVELALEKGTQITRSVSENHQRSREFVRETFGV